MDTISLFLDETAYSDTLVAPYNLKAGSVNSDEFYSILKSFSQKVVEEGRYRFYEIIQQFRNSVVVLSKENINQTEDENLIDILMLSIFWKQYKGRWGKMMGLKHLLFFNLYQIRKNNESIKSEIDYVRGKLGSVFLNKSGKENVTLNKKNLRLLNLWLSATGDFNEEVKRLNLWLEFIEIMDEEEAQNFFFDIEIFGDWFKHNSNELLGKYTKGIDDFLDYHKDNYQGREDYFFCGRTEMEYHFNMVGAEIMNQNLADEFSATQKQILLLPTCMAKKDDCKARVKGNGYECMHCTKDCNISIAANEMAKQNVETVLIKHSSNFSKWLEPWANQKRIGLIGTACVLNLIMGGYEMKRLGIPSQCVFLDSCGCKKHWCEKRNPTNINTDQVKRLVNTNN